MADVLLEVGICYHLFLAHILTPYLRRLHQTRCIRATEQHVPLGRVDWEVGILTRNIINNHKYDKQNS